MHDFPAPDHCLYTYTHIKILVNAFLRGRWDQRALLTYTILRFCHFFARKIIKTRTGNGTAHLTAYSRGLLPSSTIGPQCDLCCDISLLKKSQFIPTNANMTSKVFFCSAPSNLPMKNCDVNK